MATDVTVPDIGDFDAVPVIEIHVAVGDTVNAEDPLVTLESDKAAMDVPSPVSGVVKELKVAVNDKVSEGALILIVDEGGEGDAEGDSEAAPASASGGGSGDGGGGGAIEVTVPDIGDFDAVPVIEIHVAEGDTVAAEDPLVTLESDKAAMDVPSPSAGVVKSLKVAVNDKVSEGTVILLLEGGGGDAAPASAPSQGQPAAQGASAPASSSGRAADQPDNLPAGAYTDEGGSLRSADGTTLGADSPPPNLADFSGVHASPSVRRLARELDLDLNKVKGTGEKGRITKDDVKTHLSGGGGGTAAGAPSGSMGIPPIPTVDFSKFGAVETVEMSRIKKISGPALHRSWLNIPHVTHTDEADITETDAFRKELDTKAKEEGYRVTLLSFLIKASVSALKQHWEVNSSIAPDGASLIRKNYYNIGFAADTPGGLMVPVIKDADRKGIREISVELGDLSKKARDGALKGPDMQGASFTISSLGGIGGTHFTPIVNAPEVAILGVVRSKMAPVWNGKKFEPRNMLPLCLSYDHRAIDGALAARFSATLKTLMSDPRNLLM